MRPRHFAYLLLLLPIFIFRDYTTSNELKYLSIVDDALRDNSWFAFYNHGEVYADKPPLYFWMMKAMRTIAGSHAIWLYGLISLVSAAGIMVVMEKWMKRAGVAIDSLSSMLMLGTSVMFLGAAVVVRMDMLMCLFIVLSLYSFYKLYKGTGKPRERWLLPLWIFLAVFSKGPVGFFVPVVSIIVFLLVQRQGRTLGNYLGWRQWSVLLGLSALWFLMVYIEGGREYLDNLLVKQTVGRGVDAYHHKEPVWYYFQHLPWMLAPWTLLYITAFWTGLKRRVLKNNDLQAFFLCVIFTTFGMLTAFSSKLQVYMLPLFPFVAYLSAAYILKTGDSRWVRAGAMLPPVLFIFAFPAALMAPRYIDMGISNYLPFYIGGFLLTALSAYSLILVAARRLVMGISIQGFAILLTLAVASFGIPQINPYLGYKDMADQALEHSRELGTDNFTYFRNYKLENMDVFLGRKLTAITRPTELDSLNHSGRPSIMFMQDKQFRIIPELTDILTDTPRLGQSGGYSWYLIGMEADAEQNSASDHASRE